MTNAISTTATQLPKGFGRTPKYKTAQQLVERLTHIDELQEACNAACDYQRGMEIAAAKESLPHGEFLKALDVKGMSQQKASELRRWYEQTTQIACFEPAKAEQKLSPGARREFLRASDTTKDAVVQKINDPAVIKITAAEITNIPLSQQSRESSNTLESKQVLQQEHGHESVSRTLRILQSDVDTDGEEREATVSIMDTPEQQQIDADWRDACEHLAALEQFTRKYFDPAQGLSERRYEELWTRCDGIAYFAHMRFANQRKEDERCARQITKLVLGDGITNELEERA